MQYFFVGYCEINQNDANFATPSVLSGCGVCRNEFDNRKLKGG